MVGAFNMINEIKNMFKPNNEIFTNLKDYINANASVNTWVGRIKSGKYNPVVVFEEYRNELNTRSTTYDNTTRIMNYNINIYCSELNNSYEIVNELVVLVIEVMQGYYKMTGGLVGVIPTYDDPNKVSYQANLRFTTRFIPTKEKLY